MKFRFHREHLDESMETLIKVKTKRALMKAIQKTIDKGLSFPVEEIQFKYAGYDKRIKWDTYYVLIKWPHSGGEEWYWGVIGMSDGIFE